MSIRINKAIKELNIGLQTAVDFFEKRPELGEVKPELSFKLNDAQYDALKSHFLNPYSRTRDVAGKIELSQLNASTRPKRKSKRKKRNEWEEKDVTISKPIGKLDLPLIDAQNIVAKRDYSIFLSYKRVDKDRVFKIRDSIENAVEANCWIDLDGIESDSQFDNVIIKAINHCKVFIFIYSHAHTEIVDYENDWTVREIRFAQKKKKRIVFIKIDGSEFTDWFEFYFGTKQQIDGNSKILMEKLYSDMRKWLHEDMSSSI